MPGHKHSPTGADNPLVAEDFPPRWVGRDQHIHCIINPLQSLHAPDGDLFDGELLDKLVFGTECRMNSDGLVNKVDAEHLARAGIARNSLVSGIYHQTRRRIGGDG